MLIKKNNDNDNKKCNKKQKYGYMMKKYGTGRYVKKTW